LRTDLVNAIKTLKPFTEKFSILEVEDNNFLIHNSAKEIDKTFPIIREVKQGGYFNGLENFSLLMPYRTESGNLGVNFKYLEIIINQLNNGFVYWSFDTVKRSMILSDNEISITPRVDKAELEAEVKALYRISQNVKRSKLVSQLA